LRLAAADQEFAEHVQEREHIDATVLVKALILGVQQRPDEQGRHVLDWQWHQPSFTELGQQPAVTGVHAQRRFQAQVP